MKSWRVIGVAFGATALAALLTDRMEKLLGSPDQLLFAAAVAVTAWYGGRSAGLLASGLSVLALDYFFIPPIHHFDLDARKALFLGVFILVAWIISSTTEALRQARGLAEARADQLKELNDEERIARQRAETLAHAREEVLGVVAHDLRNPLNLIGNTAELVEMDLPAAKRTELLGVMRRSVHQMNRLIQDLLDEARIAAGKLSLDRHEVDVSEALRQAQATFRQSADERRVRLEVAGAEKTNGLTVHADADRLQQVLGNLLGNALKFTQADGSISLAAHREDGQVVFEVADTGAGIPPADVEHLFDRYWQARTADRRGIGLGLAIVKGIVEAHGGRIWVESAPGHGTTFRFTVPSVA